MGTDCCAAILSVKSALFDLIRKRKSFMTQGFDSITFLLWSRPGLDVDLMPRSNKKSLNSFVMITFRLQISRKCQRNHRKSKRILTEGPLFGSLKNFTFRTFSEMSRFHVGFTDNDSVIAWVRDTVLH